MFVIYNLSERTVIAEQARLAANPRTRFKGLMLRRPEDFQNGQALVIDPCTSIHMFFMRFPIDVLYLNRDNEVVRAQEGIRPWRVGPLYTKGARYVVELPAGAISRTQTSVGDKIRIDQTDAKIQVIDAA